MPPVTPCPMKSYISTAPSDTLHLGCQATGQPAPADSIIPEAVPLQWGCAAWHGEQ